MVALLVFAPVPSGRRDRREQAGIAPANRSKIGGSPPAPGRDDGSESGWHPEVTERLLGTTFWAGPRHRVDNARVWGRRERLQRCRGPAHFASHGGPRSN